MSKYRKRPVVIDAFRVGHDPTPGWFLDAVLSNTVTILKDAYLLLMPQGSDVAEEGDWIIKGVENEIYPCKHSIFEKTYEAVEQDA